LGEPATRTCRFIRSPPVRRFHSRFAQRSGGSSRPAGTWSASYGARYSPSAASGASNASALGSLALRVEHIGSTSIPGMAAKPVYDMQVSVRDLAEAADAFDAPLAALGLYRAP